MSIRLTGVEQINARLEELRQLGRAPSFTTRRRAVEAGASLLKVLVKEAAPSRSAFYAAKGANFGLSKKAQRLNAEYHSKTSFNLTRQGRKLRLRRAGKKAITLKESIRYDSTTGVSRHQANVKVYARKSTAHLIELGHDTKLGKRYGGKSKYYKPKPGGKGHIAARPFMKPTTIANTERVIDAISKQLGISLDNILKRARSSK